MRKLLERDSLQEFLRLILVKFVHGVSIHAPIACHYLMTLLRYGCLRRI